MTPQQLMKIIGAKRLITLAFMSAMLAIWVASFFLLIKPMRDNAQQELTSTKNQVSGLRRKINNVENDIEFMKEKIPEYEKILSQGLFDDQDRFRVVDVVEKLKEDAGVYKFSYSIDKRDVLESADADKMGYSLIKRPIKLTGVTALLDSDIFSFFQRIPKIFPLYVHIKKFRISRKKDVTMSVLQNIAYNEENQLISADIEFDWVTLSKKAAEDKKTKKDRRGRRR